MMILINRIGDSISGSVNGKPFRVLFDQIKYDEMLTLKAKSDKVETMSEMQAIIDEFIPLTRESYKELVETKTPYLFVNRHTNKFYLKFNDSISSKALPKALVDRLLESVDKNIDITPMVKFWVRFLRGPKYTDKKAAKLAEYINAPYCDNTHVQELMKEGLSKEAATEKATTTQVSITVEGLLVGYKVSKEILHRYELNENEEAVQKSRFGKDIDPITGKITYKAAANNEARIFEPAIMGQGGDEFSCGDSKGHIIRVGEVHALDSWDQVDCNDDHCGVPGLHVGGLRYIEGYQGEGTVTHNVFVDPMHIGAIVGLGFGNDGALRVKQYFIYDAFGGVNDRIYHSSKYAELTNAEYAAMVQEAVASTKMEQEKLDKMLKEQMSLA